MGSTNDKYRFHPFGDLVIPSKDDKNPPMQNVISLHKIVKNSGMNKFGGMQLQVDAQLNPDKWQVYFNDYWDVQLLLVCPMLIIGMANYYIMAFP